MRAQRAYPTIIQHWMKPLLGWNPNPNGKLILSQVVSLVWKLQQGLLCAVRSATLLSGGLFCVSAVFEFVVCW
jgi:hypothetical protein